ncbi:30S ribosomal protein S15 [Candidatus Nanoperiomorbus periodonticus]|jgi:ribosomal protein S15|uniref:30S ribosomal protein S15 n=1 Tax=Candidatus Nanoperiomorbus periodonticus TaxID=2171989 RepID=UPI00101DADCA|nr:30S ribosomal protein S15 [Candidatus Nanoperiomorbus periodonticus]MBB1556325.1 30S ribosomal protein S15 [Candidatus Saccharibacteria bacterium]RYC76311.1 30S ribosomal protein S15 [Candidatus Nanoperiomorbus periodonticus]
MITKEDKLTAIKSTQLHDGDVGSSSAQVAILTKRINEITEHMKQNKHDFMARRGLIQMVGRRKKLLKALEQTDYDQYKKVIETLGLRK